MRSATSQKSQNTVGMMVHAADFVAASQKSGLSWYGPVVGTGTEPTNWRCRSGHGHPSFSASLDEILNGHCCPLCPKSSSSSRQPPAKPQISAVRTAVDHQDAKPSLRPGAVPTQPQKTGKSKNWRLPKTQQDYEQLAERLGLIWISDVLPENAGDYTRWRCKARGHVLSKPYTELHGLAQRNGPNWSPCLECRRQKKEQRYSGVKPKRNGHTPPLADEPAAKVRSLGEIRVIGDLSHLLADPQLPTSGSDDPNLFEEDAEGTEEVAAPLHSDKPDSSEGTEEAMATIMGNEVKPVEFMKMLISHGVYWFGPMVRTDTEKTFWMCRSEHPKFEASLKEIREGFRCPHCT